MEFTITTVNSFDAIVILKYIQYKLVHLMTVRKDAHYIDVI